MNGRDLEVDDLAAAISTHESIGYRLLLIRPADDPRMALMRHNDLGEVRIRSAVAESDPETRSGSPAHDRGITVTRGVGSGGEAGRASMIYRDLVPGRAGGRLIASHISIPDGGPVPDYVHHHDVGFQIIFCATGWVDVVYEDQGPPMRMMPGDCVLQPPHIRHRVLHASPGLAVIEVCSPAEHDTLIDHDLELPTDVLAPDREFGKQRFVLHRADDAVWAPAGAGFECAVTGIGAASGDAGAVRVIRSSSSDAGAYRSGATGPAATVSARSRDSAMTSAATEAVRVLGCVAGAASVGFVLEGTVEVSAGAEMHPLARGDAFATTDGATYELRDPSPDAEILLVDLAQVVDATQVVDDTQASTNPS